MVNGGWWMAEWWWYQNETCENIHTILSNRNGFSRWLWWDLHVQFVHWFAISTGLWHYSYTGWHCLFQQSYFSISSHGMSMSVYYLHIPLFQRLPQLSVSLWLPKSKSAGKINEETQQMDYYYDNRDWFNDSYSILCTNFESLIQIIQFAIFHKFQKFDLMDSNY